MNQSPITNEGYHFLCAMSPEYYVDPITNHFRSRLYGYLEDMYKNTNENWEYVYGLKLYEGSRTYPVCLINTPKYNFFHHKHDKHIIIADQPQFLSERVDTIKYDMFYVDMHFDWFRDENPHIDYLKFIFQPIMLYVQFSSPHEFPALGYSILGFITNTENLVIR